MGVLRDIAVETQPTETQVAIPGGGVTPLCLANPNRYALGFAVTSGGPARASIKQQTTPGGGFFVSATGIDWINVRDTGALAQLAWFEINGTPGTVVTVYEVTFPLQR
jgi:hypothetical protein